MRGASGQGPAPVVELDGPVVAHRHLRVSTPPQRLATVAILERGCDKGTWAASPCRTSGRPRRSTQACAGSRVGRHD